MKNQVVIILDTEAEIPLQIGKVEANPPSTPEEMIAAITLDYATVAEAVLVLIKELHIRGIQPSSESIQKLVESIDQEFPGNFEIG